MRFETCAARAYASSLKLVSMCSDFAESRLDKMYRKACENDGAYFASGDDEDVDEDELDELEQQPIGDQSEGNPCLDFLEEMQNEHALLEKEDEPMAEDATQPPETQKDNEFDLNGVPDKEQLQSLLDKPNALEPFGLECSRSPQQGDKGAELPSTLAEALDLPGSDLFNHLFRLIIRLRSARGGIDVGQIKNARNVRRASKNLSWHQYHVCNVLQKQFMIIYEYL